MASFRAYFLFVCAFLIFSPMVYAKPTEQEKQEFSDKMLAERKDFESQLHSPRTNKHAEEIARFNKQTADEKIAFEKDTANLNFADKKAATDAYIAKRQAQLKEHNDKLRSLPPENTDLRAKRREFDSKMAKEVSDFNSR